MKVNILNTHIARDVDSFTEMNEYNFWDLYLKYILNLPVNERNLLAYCLSKDTNPFLDKKEISSFLNKSPQLIVNTRKKLIQKDLLVVEDNIEINPKFRGFQKFIKNKKTVTFNMPIKII